MRNKLTSVNRRQFVKSAAAIVIGTFSFIIAGSPGRAQGQAERDVPGMPQYICEICGYIYDPAKSDPSQEIPSGTPFEKLPDTWRCPVCGADKTMFKKTN
ncbi:MAG: rubredoxin [Syntrophales bacterium]|jgi:rubredoxin